MDEYLIYDYGDVELNEQEYFDCLMCEEIEEARREITELNADVA